MFVAYYQIKRNAFFQRPVKTISSCTKQQQQQNNNNSNKIRPKYMSRFWNPLLPDASGLIVKLFQPLLADNENCFGKYSFLKFKYSQMIT